MAERLVSFSDLSGQMAPNQEELVGVVVTDHPDLDQPVRLEALPEELKDLGKLAIAGVRLEVTRPGEERPERYILTANNFSKLATHRPMSEVLAEAQPVEPPKQQRRSHNRTASGEPLVSYGTIEHAGTPHNGKVGMKEAQLVRENLEAVNERLAAQGYRIIDPADPDHAKLYGLDTDSPPETT